MLLDIKAKYMPRILWPLRADEKNVCEFNLFKLENC